MNNSLTIKKKRITNALMLTKFITSGDYNKATSNGLVFNTGCGTLSKEICTCNLCSRGKRAELNTVLTNYGLDSYRPNLNLIHS